MTVYKAKRRRINICKDVEIAKYLTIGVGGCVDFFVKAKTEEDIRTYCKWARDNGLPFLILGSGSNLVFGEHYHGLVIKNECKGIDVKTRAGNYVEIEVAAGENLDEFIEYTIAQGFWGIENLSLIPGTVGATPVQNVGAFGQDVSRVIKQVRCYDSLLDKIVVFTNSDCEFSHRSSIFNKNDGDRYVIISVVFTLSLEPKPILHRRQLKSLRDFDASGVDFQRLIRKTIVEYRTNGINLPSGEGLGSAGTFFKTALIDKRVDFAMVLLKSARNIGLLVSIKILLFSMKYRTKHGYKIPTKILIKACGLSSLKKGSFYLLPSNPSVLVVNRNDEPSYSDMVAVINSVLTKVYEKTGVIIPIEPKLIKVTLPEMPD